MKEKVVKVKSSTMVKPATATPTTPLWLSNMDVIMPEHFHILTIYLYRSTDAGDFFDAELLKASLGRALVEFYPLAGRLNRDGNGRVEINCNGEGALFVEAECDAAVDDFADFTPRPEMSLIPKIDYSKGISSFPLLLVQVTRFKCGGVGLGFANEHHVMDGYSGSHFINTWAEIARGGGGEVTTKPFLDRRLLSARNPPRAEFPHVEYHLPPTLKNPNSSNDHETPMKFTIFKLTRNQILALKAECEEGEDNKVRYSTYETVAGHVWRCVSKVRGLPNDQETKLYIPLDGRSRLRLPLPQGYFGNVVFKATTIAKCGELESKPLAFVVGKVHEAIARMDDDYLRSSIDYLEVRGCDLDPGTRGAACFKCPNLGIVSWLRFDFYGADFGWGSPLRLVMGWVPVEGHAFVLPTPANDGSLFFAMVLPKDQVQPFQKLFSST